MRDTFKTKATSYNTQISEDDHESDTRDRVLQNLLEARAKENVAGKHKHPAQKDGDLNRESSKRTCSERCLRHPSSKFVY
jgi:hypothetical protein